MRTGPISNALLASLAVGALFGGLAGCGGGTQPSPPPPTPDFSISVSPTSASGTIGNMSSTVTVSVTSQNGFNGSVTVTLQGLPSGVNASPGSSFDVQSG